MRVLPESRVAILTALLLATSTGCKFLGMSKVKALESDDWFRDGVDRFYLAVAPQDLAMPGSVTDAKVGQELLFGIGCYGEPKQRDAVVPVAPDACGQGPDRLPLNERYLVNHFPLAADSTKPKKGECVVLMGDDQMLAHLQLFPKDFQTGLGAEALQTFFWSAGTCAVSLALLKQPIRAAVGNAISNAGARATGLARGAKQNVAGSYQSFARRFTQLPRSLIGLKAGTSTSPGLQLAALRALASHKATVPIVAARAFPAVGTATATMTSKLVAWSTSGAAKLGPIASLLLPTTGVGGKVFAGFSCFGTAASLWNLVADGQRNKNRAAFFRGLGQADTLTQEQLRADPAGDVFRTLVGQGSLREAAAIYNPLFARQFNKNVIGAFEQGWEMFGNRPQAFFDTVRDIQVEIESASQKAEVSGTLPEGAFGAGADPGGGADLGQPQTAPTQPSGTP